MLIINNLCKQFDSRVILNKVSLKVKPGEIAVLLGPSGVGKSTLLRILAGLDTFNDGSILYNNLPLDTTSTPHTVGMVFQNFNLFDHLSVERNITLALEKVAGKTVSQAELRADELLKQYGLQAKKYAYPPQLSGGQKQRLAIARALALEPRIICLDEPTSALDPLLTAWVAQAIQELAQQGYIVIVASHDTDLIRRLTCTIYLMQEGTIIEHAHSNALSSDPTAYPRLSAFISGNQNP